MTPEFAKQLRVISEGMRAQKTHPGEREGVTESERLRQETQQLRQLRQLHVKKTGLEFTSFSGSAEETDSVSGKVILQNVTGVTGVTKGSSHVTGDTQTRNSPTQKHVSDVTGKYGPSSGTLEVEQTVTSWLNANPDPSSPDGCAHCGQRDYLGDPLLPFGVASMGHTWLHRTCWTAWAVERRQQAIAALTTEPDRRSITCETFAFERMVALYREAPVPLATKVDEAEMLAAYLDFVAINDTQPDPNYIDFGTVPEDFLQAWRDASARWFDEVWTAAQLKP
jgi:hypothetical protein